MNKWPETTGFHWVCYYLIHILQTILVPLMQASCGVFHHESTQWSEGSCGVAPESNGIILEHVQGCYCQN